MAEINSIKQFPLANLSDKAFIAFTLAQDLSDRGEQYDSLARVILQRIKPESDDEDADWGTVRLMELLSRSLENTVLANNLLDCLKSLQTDLESI